MVEVKQEGGNIPLARIWSTSELLYQPVYIETLVSGRFILS